MPIIALSICTTSVYYGVPIYGSCEQRIQPQYVYTTPSQMHTTSTELVNLDLIDLKQVNVSDVMNVPGVSLILQLIQK